MDDLVVSLEDMARATAIDARLELLLAGDTPAGDSLDEDLSALIAQINELVPEPVIAPEMANAQIAKIVETVAAAGPRTVPQPQPQPPRLGWRARLSSLSATPARKIAAATLSLSATLSGLAYAGVLPDPLQRTAADIARIVGVKLPDPDDVTSEDSDPGEKTGPENESGSTDPVVDDNGKPAEGTGGAADDSGKGSDEDPSANDDEGKGRGDDSEGDEPSSGDDGEASDDSGSDDGSGSDSSDEGADDEGSGSDPDEDVADPDDPPEADDPPELEDPPEVEDPPDVDTGVDDDGHDDALDNDIEEPSDD